MNEALIRDELGDDYVFEYFDELASTNDLAMERARHGAPSGTIICADYQHAGRGRRGAPRVSPPGAGVLFSLLLRPAAPLPPHHWAILTGVGVAHGLRDLGVMAKIKWPNDLILDDRKIGGILVETVPEATVIGVGINCRTVAADFPEALRSRAASLHMLTPNCPSREAVLLSVVRQLREAAQLVEAGGIIKMLYAWNTMNWYARRKVRVSGPMGAVDGDGLFLDGRKLVFHVFKDHGVVAMPLSSTVEVR